MYIAQNKRMTNQCNLFVWVVLQICSEMGSVIVQRMVECYWYPHLVRHRQEIHSTSPEGPWYPKQERNSH